MPTGRASNGGVGGGGTRGVQDLAFVRSFTSLLLILACIALGAAGAWGVKEYRTVADLTRQRQELRQRNWEVENAYVSVVARRDDLVNFMIDPRTRLYRLQANAQTGAGPLTIAWQDQTRVGFVIGDRVPLPPDGRKYAVWMSDGSARQKAVSFLPEPGMTCVEFHLRQAEPAQGFEVTLEEATGAAQTAGPVMYR